ncbi:MAG: hypothetical protein B7O98_01215 [Zestosphaera tikiterensis]|uniref:Uncharacterized protein n=1 Tax=Zestosphaera tikiterensis TaxID=1973259 RepID=A0A2R7Y6D0_9CREN|nr:MAG: hypothetical protein B7O98_01215 [Zestosphaera tikiterensis]
MNAATAEFTISCLEMKELPISEFLTLSVYEVKHSETLPASLSVNQQDLSQLKLTQLLNTLLPGRVSKFKRDCDAVNIDSKYLDAFVKLKKVNLRTLLLFYKPSKLKEIQLINTVNAGQNNVDDESQNRDLTSLDEEGLNTSYDKLTIVKTVTNGQGNLIVYDAIVKTLSNDRLNDFTALKIITEDGFRVLLSDEIRKYVEKASVKPYLTKKKRRVRRRGKRKNKRLKKKNVKKSK